MTNLNITELKQVLDCAPACTNILLVGDHGIGKSEILTQYYARKGMKVQSLFLSQMSDVADLLGLPRKDEASGKTVFMPPFWWPVDGQPICLFLDEISRARPEILSAVMDLTLNRTLAGRKLPEGSMIIAATNEGEKYIGTNEMDPALVSRFSVFRFQPSHQEWLVWARKEKLDTRVTDFIQENPGWLDGDPDARADADTGLEPGPNRRAWTRVARLIEGRQIDKLLMKAMAGDIGVRAASLFADSISRQRMVNGRQVLYEFDKYRKQLDSYAAHELSVVTDSIFQTLETQTVIDKETAVKNINAFFDFCTSNHKENAAYFSQQYVSKTYKTAVAWIAKNTPTLAMSMVYYIQSIK